MSELTPLLNKVADGSRLTREEARHAFTFLMSGKAEDVEIAGFLMALRTRGESAEEIAAGAQVMREKSLKVGAPQNVMDTCGTGGSGCNTYNISTAAAFVVAACGIPVAKHGNRATSSRCGSADVLSALGVRPDIPPEQIERCLREAGIGFLFAPAHHPAVKHVAPVRQKLATRSIFNLLGPLCNPAGAERQIMGVFSKAWPPLLAEALGNLGSRRAWVVHGADGLDELSTSGINEIAELRNGKVRNFQLSPEGLGLPRAAVSALRGGDPDENAKALRALLSGKKSPYRDITLLNAAAALTIAGEGDETEIKENLLRAGEAIDSGEAKRRLEILIALSNEAPSTEVK